MELKERAMQCYMVLLGAAHNRQTLTYEILGDMIGLPPVGIGQILGYIMAYCHNHGLPPLTVLIVQKHTGKPGEGLATSDPKDFDKNRERVYARQWYRDAPITPDTLRDEWTKYNNADNR